MDQSLTVARLNELLQLFCRSLPVYLASARPWAPWGYERALDVLRLIGEDHLLRVQQIGNHIVELGGAVVTGEFPIEFTDLHDLSVHYVLDEVARHQQHDVARIEELARKLSDDPRAKALAEEALGAAKGHVQSVQELIDEARRY